jgi:tetratricopeptide (TPR) repeat protein
MDETERVAHEARARSLEAGGQAEQALRAYVQIREFESAARVARRLGRLSEAAEFFTEAGKPFEAAACHFEAGATGPGLESLARVERTDPRYREACREAVAHALELGTVSLGLENLLAEFIRSGPRDGLEINSFFELGQLYLRQGLIENGREVVAKVLKSQPAHRAAQELLVELDQRQPRSSVSVDLPDLPELPSPMAPAPVTASPERRDPAPPGRGPLFAVGATVAGRYRLLQKIGQGGISVVFRAADDEIGTDVALKVFTQAVFDEDTDLRFKRELLLSRQLAHPNVIRLFDTGSHFGFRYLSMELLLGSDLSHVLRKAKRLPVPLALDYMIQTCGALEAAHKLGIVHRDIKPGNLFVTADDVLKVMDFGIAKLQAAPGLTATGFIAGTPGYMAPEQISNFSGVTASADLYALGVVGYEMLTGGLPFRQTDVMSLLTMHLKETPPPLRPQNPDIPEVLERLILDLLAKEPDKRPPSAGEVHRALTAIRERS